MEGRAGSAALANAWAACKKEFEEWGQHRPPFPRELPGNGPASIAWGLPTTRAAHRPLPPASNVTPQQYCCRHRVPLYTGTAPCHEPLLL